jgi:putative membrane protein
MQKLFSNIISAILGLWLAVLFVPGTLLESFGNSSFFGFALTEKWQIFLLLGIILGLINFFIKPIISGITLPLRIITLGLFSVVINMAMIWLLDIMFAEITIPLWLPLLETSLIVWIINFLLLKLFHNED